MGYLKKIYDNMEQVERWPISPDSVMTMAALLYIKEHYASHAPKGDSGEEAHVRHFDRQMAEEWTAQMRNADGTKGPHFSMEKAKEVMSQYDVDCDPTLFWVVMNSLYSDYCEALRESSVSTQEVYVRLAKAWIYDKDAVPDKAAAYYTYVVQH